MELLGRANISNVAIFLLAPFLFTSNPVFVTEDSLGHSPNRLAAGTAPISEILLLQVCSHLPVFWKYFSRRPLFYARRMDNLDRLKRRRYPALRWHWPPYTSSDSVSLFRYAFRYSPAPVLLSLLDTEIKYPVHGWFAIGEGYRQERIDMTDHAASRFV